MLARITILIFTNILGIFLFFTLRYERLLDGVVKFYADENNYRDVFDAWSGGVADLLITNINLLGPLLIYRITDGIDYNIFVFNLIIFNIGSIAVIKLINTQNYTFILLNPVTFFSLISINKEIFGFISIIFLVLYLRDKRRYLLLISLSLALFCRWQLILIILVIINYNWKKNKSFLVLLIALSILYSLFYHLFPEVNNYAQFLNQRMLDNTSGTGIYFLLSSWQNSGIYFLIFPFKLAFSVFAQPFHFDRIFSMEDFLDDFYNSFILLIQSLIHGILLCKIAFVYFKEKKLINSYGLSRLRIIIFSQYFILLSPIHPLRYLYPVIVLSFLLLPDNKSLFINFSKLKR